MRIIIIISYKFSIKNEKKKSQANYDWYHNCDYYYCYIER